MSDSPARGAGDGQSVVITDGEQRAALAIARSLGSVGYRVVVTSPSGRSVAGASRHASADVAIPSSDESPEAFYGAVADIVRDEDADLLIPVTESALFAVLPGRNEISARIPFPGIEAFRAVCDKRRVLEVAGDLGIRTPAQQIFSSGGAVGELDFPYPVVLKPYRSVYTAPDGSRGRVGVRWAHDRPELERHLATYPEVAFPMLLQEAVVGPGIGIFVLLHDGAVVASFSHRRIREKPPSGGVSVLRQSEPMDVELLQRSVALLKSFDWSGVAMVEYKRDESTRDPVLMEVNGRFWGSLQLAIDADVDFPKLLADLSFGRSVEPVEGYDFVRSRWFWGDVDHVLAQLRDPRTSWGTRLAALLGLIAAFGPGYRQEVFRWRDPAPFFRESRKWFADVFFGKSR